MVIRPREPATPSGPSRLELMDKLQTARAAMKVARDDTARLAVTAVALAGDVATARRVALAEHANAERLAIQLADLLVVLAERGVDIDNGDPADVLAAALDRQQAVAA